MGKAFADVFVSIRVCWWFCYSEEAFGELCRDAMPGNGFAEDTERRSLSLNHKAGEARGQLTKQLLALEERVKRIMTASQLHVIDEFKPRLVPAGNLKDPSRTELGEKPVEPKGQIDNNRDLPAEFARSHYSLGKVGRHFLDPSIVGLLEDRHLTVRESHRPEDRRFEQIPDSKTSDSQAPVRVEVSGEVRVRARWRW